MLWLTIICIFLWIISGVLTIGTHTPYKSLKIQYILCWIALLFNLIWKVTYYL